MERISTIGLDIAKNSFAVHGFDAEGHSVLAKELKRGQVLAFFARHAPCRVAVPVTAVPVTVHSIEGSGDSAFNCTFQATQ